jgi:hypothetical protein
MMDRIIHLKIRLRLCFCADRQILEIEGTESMLPVLPRVGVQNYHTPTHCCPTVWQSHDESQLRLVV